MAVADDFAALQAEVANNTTVGGSALALINGMVKQISDLQAQLAAGNPITSAQLQALTTQLQTNDQQLASAVAANTTPTP